MSSTYGRLEHEGLGVRVMRVLALARWAPSGDNAQPWRFEVVGENRVRIHGFDTWPEVLYDYKGWASRLAIGALLETIDIAASLENLTADIEMFSEDLKFEICFQADDRQERNPLAQYIERRVTQRKPLSPKSLTKDSRNELRSSVGGSFSIVWKSSLRERLRMAGLLWRNGHLRLVTPEVYPVHRDAIEWKCQKSADKIPDEAVGLNYLSVKIMRWAMANQARAMLVNKALGAAWVSSLELDAVPAVFCGSYMLLCAEDEGVSLSHHVAAGRAVQRLWLTATKVGLQFQPQYSPLVFWRLVSAGERFTSSSVAWRNACKLAVRMEKEFGVEQLSRAVFLARVGYGKFPAARSERRPLSELLV